MKKYFICALALLLALSLVSFTNYQNQKTKVLNTFNWYYFHFVGIRNCEEGDRTKWQLIPYSLYLMQPCGASHFGCKLIATEVELVDGVIRPKEMYIEPGTNDPKTGAFVMSVSNHEN